MFDLFPSELIVQIAVLLPFADSYRFKRSCKLFFSTIQWNHFDPYADELSLQHIPCYFSPIEIAAENNVVEAFEAMQKDSRILLRRSFEIAIDLDCIDIVSLLLRDERVDPAARFSHGYVSAGMYPIVFASDRGCDHILKMLLADRRIDPSVENNFVLIFAIENRQFDVMTILLADNRIYLTDDLIPLAAKSGSVDVVKILLEDDRLKSSSIDFNFAIRQATKYGHVDIVKVLLKDQRFFPGPDETLLKMAIKNKQVEIAKLILKDPRVDPSANSNFAIIQASEFGLFEIVFLLLQDHRTNPAANDNYPIEVASEKGFVNVVKVLLSDPRVDPTSKNDYALRYASRNGHCEVVKLLLMDDRINISANISHALHMASENGHLDVVGVLKFNKSKERE
ncbi:hypothetical protein HK096_003601 [Nowakowskiella sp. JEL0078]|nr:hypothetical protein HK096_003601 [Nowakowskiella sp. JEL0078]